VGAFLVPGIVAIARGAEMVGRSSLYRAASELLMAPLAPHDKRSAKLILDVGADRLGDLLGAQVVGVLLLAMPSAIVVAAIVLGVAAFAVAVTVPRAYRSVLEQRLVANATPVAPSIPLPSLFENPGFAGTRSAAEGQRGEAIEPPPALHDELAVAIADLRSGDVARVERRLAEPLAPELAAAVVPLVAWTPVASLVAQRLRELAPRVTGLLVDALLDPDGDFTVRRRLPAVLVDGDAMLAGVGLWRALSDPRFEVRYRAGKALARMRTRGDALPVTAEHVFDTIEREVRVDTRIWHSYQLLDGVDGSEADQLVHRVLEQRSATALDHVFTLLGLVLPAEPVRMALHALGTDDALLRGTALEYLEGVLPDRIRVWLWPFLELGRSSEGGSRTPAELMSELRLSHPSIVANLRSRASDNPVDISAGIPAGVAHNLAFQRGS
jgi:hypothetical protein